MARERQDEALLQEVGQSREERAQAFATYLKERVIDWQYKSRVWVTSATELGKMLGVSDVTANDWLRGKKIPRREHCLRIAHVLGVPATEVLEAAGYPASQDDSYNTYATLLTAVKDAERWPAEKREWVRLALEEALSPEFNFDPQAGEWKELATLVLHQKIAPLSKAEKIARIVTLWRQES